MALRLAKSWYRNLDLGKLVAQRDGSEVDLQAVEEELTRVETARLTRALTQLRAWGADCAGLGVRSALSAPEAWRQVKGNWSEWFARLEPNLEVQVDIQD